MASYLVHLAIAAEVNKTLNIDENDFFVGNLSPDMKNMVNKRRRETHFEVESPLTPYGRSVDVNLFINKYRDKIKQSDFLKGYLCHIMTDKYWFEEFIYRYIQLQEDGKYLISLVNGEKVLGDFETFKDIMYEEYKYINNYLLEKYELNFNLIDKDEYYIIEEIVKGGNTKVFESLNQYLTIIKKYNESDFKLTSAKDIDDFFKVTSNRIIDKIREI